MAIQIRLRSLMGVIGALAGVTAVYRELDWEFVVLLFIGIAVAAATSLLLKGRRGVSWWCFIIGATGTNLLSVMLVIFYHDVFGFIIFLFVLMLFLPASVGSGAAWAAIATVRTTTNRRSATLAWTLVFALGLLPLSMPFRSWPLRAAFFVSMSSMDHLADRLAAGQLVHTPVRAGCFTIVGTAGDLSTGNVALIIDLDPAGRTAFVRIGSLLEPERRVGPLYNLSVEENMCGRWWFQQED
jgi:hypothetical protein